jgi:predicted Zn finger-like uncharacterized protein
MIDVRMITRCPYCDTAFRVYEHQLARREGKVRCGACGNVFDAYQTLEHGADPLAIDTATATAPDEFGTTAPRPATGLIERERRLEARRRSAQAAAAAAPDEAIATLGSHDAAAPPAPAYEPGAAPTTGEADGRERDPATERDTPVVDPAATYSESRLRPVEARARDSDSAKRVPDPLLDDLGETGDLGRAAVQIDDPSARDVVFGPVERSASTATRVLAVLLALALSVQSLFWFRDELAARLPPLGQLLTDACRLVGCQVRLPRHADLIAIESSELQSDPMGVLVLSTTLRNKAGFAQALPALELTLTDAREQPVVRRVLAPRDYLGKPEEPGLAIPAGGELATRVYIDAQAAGASGYRVFIFYP